ncbi:histidine kinase [Saccharobesus litoralis]|uniref:Histidine kinase n=1 Tax=Saccharobesus litoralis TaxID=2172099 RepID=A0A2S0VV74_9ALTE|nr:HDOD domain-containing protein [Saccharobesus litoralis]AWB68108.1 histidine kinase [Saccharobesus litoralis]
MKVYTARQAIFNRKGHVVAYELLFRDGPENFFPDVEPHEATQKLIVRTHLSQGLKHFTADKPALINFSQECLIKRLPMMLPNKQIMIEVLESVEPTDEVYEAIRELFHQGYHIALDDFVYQAEWERFFKFVKLIKFDISQTPIRYLEPLVKQLKAERKNIKILAEKVETKQEVIEAAKMGFDYFQGYFFCKPEMTEKRDVESNKHILLSLYRETLKPEINVKNISKYFEQDLNLSYKLLRFINSGVLPIREKISSIKQAIVYLGESETRKLIAILTTGVLAFDKPKELIRVAILRARFCEILITPLNSKLAESAFLTGLFSLLDAVLDQPMAQILEQLPLAKEIEVALRESEETQICIILRAIKLYESGSWYNTSKEANKLGISYEQLGSAYSEALNWVAAYDRNET